jgi:hypothetical protein
VKLLPDQWTSEQFDKVLDWDLLNTTLEEKHVYPMVAGTKNPGKWPGTGISPEFRT